MPRTPGNHHLEEDLIPVLDSLAAPRGLENTQDIEIRSAGRTRARGRRLAFILTVTLAFPLGVTDSPAFAVDTGMPVGDLPGWERILTQDFDTPVALGTFPGSAYRSQLFPYSGADTFGHGRYDAGRVNSVSNSALDWYLHKENSQAYVSALVVEVPGTNWGQQYGRYSVRYQSELVRGYKMAFLLWPDSNNWGEGEVDYAEASSLDTGSENAIYANVYPKGNSWNRPGVGTRFQTNTRPADSGWHVATIEWTPYGITFVMNGVTVGTATGNIPDTSMHWVLQVETSLGGPGWTEDAGHLNVDWIAMYRYAPRA